MSERTLHIDSRVYEGLLGLKAPDESFSELLERLMDPVPKKTPGDLMETLRGGDIPSLSDEGSPAPTHALIPTEVDYGNRAWAISCHSS